MDLRSLMPFRRKQVPVRRGDYDPFSIFRDEVDRIFDEFARGFWGEEFERRSDGFSPRVDVVESDREVRITAELPGMDERDIEVSINRDLLTIKGEKKEEKEESGRNYYRAERLFGSFSRTIPLPAEVDVDKAKAEFRKGLLVVTVPKTPEAITETKRIPIKTE